ncbi:MAG: thioredoxin [Candidatus Hydrogenedentes bacterium]|nr:thioredoxin [Candidatus Hydrogenedentota bacterium]
MGKAVELTKSNFAATVSGGVTLVDFWAEWCGPCRMVAPVIEELAGQYEGKAKIGKVNVDHEQALAEQFGVSSIPTLVVLKDGKEATRFVGVTAKDQLSKAIDAAL